MYTEKKQTKETNRKKYTQTNTRVKMTVSCNTPVKCPSFVTFDHCIVLIYLTIFGRDDVPEGSD